MFKSLVRWASAAITLVCNGFCALATVYDSDGSSTNIQYIHDTLAQNGDTITLPAGTFTWSTHVHVTKNITLEGSGQDSTIIYDNVPKTSGDSSIMLFCTGITDNLRITGFTIRGQAQDTNNFNKGTVVIRGSSHSVRIDHVTFDRPGTGAIQIGDAWGVVDHCYFNEPNSKNGVHVEAPNYGGAPGFGDGSWEDATHYESGEGVYIEDNTFVGSGLGGATAFNAVTGGRGVFRHNTLIDQNTGGHGLEGARKRGMRSVEIYQNTLTTSVIMDKAIQLRGGTGVIWGNTAQGIGGTTGYKNFVSAYNFRSINQYTNNNFGWASGSNPWDENTDQYGYKCLIKSGQDCASTRFAEPTLQSISGLELLHGRDSKLSRSMYGVTHGCPSRTIRGTTLLRISRRFRSAGTSSTTATRRCLDTRLSSIRIRW